MSIVREGDWQFSGIDGLRASVARFFVIGLWLHLPVLVAIGLITLDRRAPRRRAGGGPLNGRLVCGSARAAVPLCHCDRAHHHGVADGLAGTWPDADRYAYVLLRRLRGSRRILRLAGDCAGR